VESVRTRGEASLFVIGDRVVSQVDKRPGGGAEVRVNEEFGGVLAPVAIEPEARELALASTAWLSGRFGRSLDYARVDLLEYGGRWVVSEL